VTISVVTPQEILQDIARVSHDDLETAGVMLVNIMEAPGGDIRLLARKMLWADDHFYTLRGPDGMIIKPEGYIHALALAESIGAACLWVHTHPGNYSAPVPSDHDHLVDKQISDLFRLRSGSLYYGTLIFSPRENGLVFTGRLQAEGCGGHVINYIWQVGSRWRLFHSYDHMLAATEEGSCEKLFDRNIRAFGPAIQKTLGDLTIGVVGCGGTGSIIAEQLVRLGVRKLFLIDPKELSESNLTRVYGAVASDVGSPKVQILRDHLVRIAPELHCRIEQSMVTVEATARNLVNCDVIFGCTDDNAGRLVLSRLSSYMLIPVIDCGVLLSSGESGQLTGIDGRVTVLYPGSACLQCRGRVDLRRAGSEMLPPEDRERLVNEGYAPALEGIEPAVVTFTSMVGATAVSELLERLIGYGVEPPPNELLLRCHEREISTNIAVPRENHFCDPNSGKLGAGITDPFLGRTWG
jgi:molybdopterin/thiamine biosynthesis adenylyltransferase